MPGVIVFFPKLSMDFDRKISSFFILLIGTVSLGHLPFLVHAWVAFIFFLVYVDVLSGIKLGLIYVQKLDVSTSSCINFFKNLSKKNIIMHAYINKRWLVNESQTWMVWFLSRGWSKAGWLCTGTQSIISPSSLFTNIKVKHSVKFFPRIIKALSLWICNLYNIYHNGYKSLLVEPLQKSLYFDFLVIGELFSIETRREYHSYHHQCYRETGHSHLVWLIIILN